MNSPVVFAVAQGALRRRSDPRHVRLTVDLGRVLPSAKFPLVPLGALLDGKPVYGTNATPTAEPVGYPVLRPNNVTPDGLEMTDLKFWDAPEAEVERLTLREGDLLVNRVNALEHVGKAAVFAGDGVVLHTTNILRLRLNRDLAVPEFVASFLNSPAGRLQSERLGRPITGVAAINTQELSSILIPLPSVPVQTTLLAPLRAALDGRRDKRTEARRLLLDIGDDFARLVEPSVEAAPALAFATTIGEMRRIGRMAPSFFNPARIQTMTAILEHGVPVMPLLDVADFVNERADFEEEADVLGLAAIEAHTGEFIGATEPAKSGKCYRAEDVLFSRLMPHLNKVAVAPSAGICSPEFHVLRVKQSFSTAYLAVALRSTVVLRQVSYMAGGGSRPRLVETDARSILVPVPDAAVQAEITQMMTARQSDARRLRLDAEAGWTTALGDFSDALMPGIRQDQLD